MPNWFFLNQGAYKIGEFLREVKIPLFFCLYVTTIQMLVN